MQTQSNGVGDYEPILSIRAFSEKIGEKQDSSHKKVGFFLNSQPGRLTFFSLFLFCLE